MKIDNDDLQKEKIYSVSQLNSEARSLLEDQFPTIWVEGEISNFIAASSGHWYFSLKDVQAQVRCALFRGNQRKLDFTPKNGSHVLIRARVSLYENRGEFQLIADHLEERGEGQLRRQFEQLKKKLAETGFFDPANKKPIPRFPTALGIITSPTGAAVRDILNVLKRRFPSLPIIIYPTLVQGELAAKNIVSAIECANRRNECTVLILARGGGSLEDLWPFNEEIVAKAIFASTLPIISGVGHEIDFTIADFVADLRAPTPSAAAELAVPDAAELAQLFDRLHQQLNRHITQLMQNTKHHLNWVQKHLTQQHPQKRLQEKMQRLDFYQISLFELLQRRLNQYQQILIRTHSALDKQLPRFHITVKQNELNTLYQKLLSYLSTQIMTKKSELAAACAKLNAMSPLAILHRGYAIAETLEGKVIRKQEEVQSGDKIKLQLEKGLLNCIVE